MAKKVTIYDIAEKLNIAAATVSRALNDNPKISDDTKKLVMETAVKMNYRQNRLAIALKSGKTNNVGVIVPRVNTNFFGSVIRGIEDELNASGYQVIICQTHNDEEKEADNVESLLNSQVDAIFMSTSSRNTDTFDKILKKKIPLIFFDRKKTMDNVSSVTIDDFAGGYIATKHLIDQGCKKIAHVSTGDLNIEIFRERFAGYKQALYDNNIPFNEEYVLTTKSNIEDGREAVKKLFSLKNKPDAIFSASDFVALGAIKELQEMKIKVPKDVAIVGFSNEPFTNFLELSISTVDQFPLEMGRMTARVFLTQTDMTDLDKIQKKVVIEPKLIVRKSSDRIS